MNSDDIKIFIRDANLNRVGQIDDYQAMTVVQNFCDVSKCALTISPAIAAASKIGFNGMAGIIVEREGTQIFSGPYASIKKSASRNNSQLTLNVFSDDVYLMDRLALPSSAPYSADDYDNQSGLQSTVMRTYVNRNLIAGTYSVLRNIANLSLGTDPLVGNSGAWQARMQTVLALLKDISTFSTPEIGFKITQQGTALVFDVYQPTDRSADVVFSFELGNLSSYDYETTRPVSDYVIVGGGGDGTSRTFSEGGDDDEIGTYGRIETFRDRRDTTDSTQLLGSQEEELTNNGEKTSLQITPIDTEGIQYLTHYQLGDQVAVIVDGEEINDVVRQVTLTYTPGQPEVLTPVIGSANASGALSDPEAKLVSSIFKRLVNLERTK